MIQGIPYFGEDTQEIYDKILNDNDELVFNQVYDSLYDLVMSNINRRIIVVIDNKWLTWLNDIVFNYRDKKCYIPYYEYEVFEIPDKHFKTNDKGHLILNDDTLSIRYNYKYCKYNINVDNLSLYTVDLDTFEKCIYRTSKWIADTKFDIEKLYKLYIESSYKEDDFEFNSHDGGYHFIDKSIKSFKNREKKYREQYNLFNYSEDFKYEPDYRDVRNFKYNEVIQKYGLLDNIEIYKLRRLRFDSYLYCILRQEIECSNNEFNKKLQSLYNDKNFIKYGKSIKLIFKNYWLNGGYTQKRTTWCRVKN